MSKSKDELIIPALEGYPQPIAEGLQRLQDARSRTLKALEDTDDAALDWHAPSLQNAIGMLLYHIAAIEIDWLYAEVLQQDFLPEIESLFPHPVRDERGRLYPVIGLTMADHLERLEATRRYLLDGFKTITITDYRTVREMPNYFVTPEWVLHHLAQHEAEHRGEILTIKTLYGAR